MSDFIIIGAGSAGCILANRLSVDPATRVTLLEAGGSDKHFLYAMPAGYFGLMKLGIGNWHYQTTPQPGMDGRSIYCPRGKVLGGSSSINGLNFSRGNPGDFDHWAQLGNRGWSFDDCLPYFKKLENFAGEANPYRGKDGPIGVSMAPPVKLMSPIGKAVMAAAVQAGYPINRDVNGATQEGFSRVNVNIAEGRRQSTASTYLSTAIKRPNLRVITGALTTRILVRNGRAIGVEYIHKGRWQTLETSGEVILAGGVINSPQLLQLSGIGPAPLLAEHGIPVIQDLPGVGENLHDHVSVSVQQEITKPYSALSQLDSFRTFLGLAQYLLFKSGPTLSNGQELTAFLKTRSELEYPDLQYHFVPLIFHDHGHKIIPREGFSVIVNMSRPLSRGRVAIASADPNQAPLIDPNYLAKPDDLRVLRDGIRMARKLIAQTAFDDFRGSEYAPGIDTQSDVDLDAFIRATGSTVYHPVGTCKMGSDAMAVVDSQLRVHGVAGLRVVDASIMPSIVSANTNAATMMIAEKAAATITGGALENAPRVAAQAYLY